MKTTTITSMSMLAGGPKKSDYVTPDGQFDREAWRAAYYQWKETGELPARNVPDSSNEETSEQVEVPPFHTDTKLPYDSKYVSIISAMSGQISDGIGEGMDKESRLFVWRFGELQGVSTYEMNGHLIIECPPDMIGLLSACIWTICKIERKDKDIDDSQRNRYYQYLDADWADICKLQGALKKVTSSIDSSVNHSTKSIKSDFEDQLVEYLQEQGEAVDQDDNEFCPIQLATGILVEMEHTDSFDAAKEIAKDHLTEDAEYYGKFNFPEEAESRIEEITIDDFEPSEVTSGYHPWKQLLKQYLFKASTLVGNSIEGQFGKLHVQYEYEPLSSSLLLKSETDALSLLPEQGESVVDYATLGLSIPSDTVEYLVLGNKIQLDPTSCAFESSEGSEESIQIAEEMNFLWDGKDPDSFVHAFEDYKKDCNIAVDTNGLELEFGSDCAECFQDANLGESDGELESRMSELDSSVDKKLVIQWIRNKSE